MLVFSIIPQAMRVETNSGQEKVEHFALSMLNHFKNCCETGPPSIRYFRYSMYSRWRAKSFEEHRPTRNFCYSRKTVEDGVLQQRLFARCDQNFALKS
jgi:hypothetical protein